MSVLIYTDTGGVAGNLGYQPRVEQLSPGREMFMGLRDPVGLAPTVGIRPVKT